MGLYQKKKPWLFPSEDSQNFPPPRPPRLLVSSPEPPCGTAQTEPSGSDHTLRTPAHPTSRVSTLVTTAGTPPVSPPTQRPSPPTESASRSTPDGPCPELSDASSLRSSTPPTTPLGSRPVPSSSPTVVLTTSATHPWSTPEHHRRLGMPGCPHGTRRSLQSRRWPSWRASTHSVLLTTLIPSLSSRSRRSRTDVLLCSPCSDSTFSPSSPERVQSPTGRTTLPTHGPSTDSLRSSPPSSPHKVSLSCFQVNATVAGCV